MIENNIHLQNETELASERFNLVAKATHDVIWDWDLYANTVWWNEGMREIFGFSVEELEPGPDSWYNRIHPEDQERVLLYIHEVIDNGGANWSDQYRFRRANGSYAYVHDRGYTIHKDGRAIRMVGSMQDITEQMAHQHAREESEKMLSFALKAAQLGTWNLNPATNQIAWDERCRELFGFPEVENLSYEGSLQNLHPEDRPRVQAAVKQALAPGSDGIYNIQFRTVIPGTHTLRWLQCKGQAYFVGDQVDRFSGIAQDITDQIASQEKAYFADQQATMTIEGTGAGSFLLDVSSNELVYSPTMARILTGNTSENLSRSIFIDHLHPDDIAVRDGAYVVAAETGELNYEARFIWTDNSVHWVKVIGRYLYDNSDKGVSLSGIVLDITDRIEKEQMLRASEEYLRSMIEQAPIATALFVGPDMVIEIPNEPMLKFWGKGADVIGKPLREAVPELVGQHFLEILDEVYRTGKAYHAYGAPADLVIDGLKQTIYFDFTYKPILDKNGQVFAIIDMAVDVSAQVISARELKESEERYRQLADELEQRVEQRTNELYLTNQELTNSNNNLEQFAYAASHDMQEPLRKIQSFSSRLQSQYNHSLDENGSFMLNRIQDAARRMSLLIDDLLTYSRLSKKDTEFVNVDLNKIVSEVISDLEIGIQEQNAKIETGNLSVVHGNPRQLVQLMQNLISNAIKYRSPDREPMIKITEERPGRVELSSIPHLLRNRRYCRITIEDNGIGFEEKYVDRIFQMFQRLHGKSEYSGSGIGLASCKKVVQNHNGYITAKSKPGEGSRFIIYLPQPE
ncbi:PAS domain-containing protein [Dyadobacter sp. CY312]|uniref:PAS domain-containing protein n=1 Tax=Dyadobacter sp. CY312 TaxID=2907303 RepID=UPI001F477ED0|nr:PAS domain-containing protein [Dyadobacter sp. CY312]MCE7038807.1 PAS domain-containing protein [Dyadobacter sp. CY312]